MPFKKTLSVLLAIVFVFCSVQIAVSAQEDDIQAYDMPKRDGNPVEGFTLEEIQGTKEKPFQIRTAEQLELFRDTVNACADEKIVFYAELRNNICLNDIADWERWGAEGYDDTHLKLWDPIDATKVTPLSNGERFDEYTNTIHFNGNGNTISGLYIKNTDGFDAGLGLFSMVDSKESTLSNIKISHSCISGRGDLGQMSNVGGIAGYSSATIENCSVDTSVISGAGNIGGIVGQASTIVNCTVDASVSVSGEEYIGGIAGYAKNTINNCRTAASVSGGKNIGGIAGYGGGVIVNCTNLGNVAGNTNVGGIAGHAGQIQMCWNNSAVSGQEYVGGISGQGTGVLDCYNRGNIAGASHSRYIGGITGLGMANTCYNTGSVQGARDVGPICGKIQARHMLGNLTEILGGTFIHGNFSVSSNCYYLKDDNLKTDDAYSVALTAEQMRHSFCYTNWDFVHIWTMPKGGGYPRFIKDVVVMQDDYDDMCNEVRIWKGEIAEGFADGDGTSDHPYLIDSAEQLAYLAKTVNDGEPYTGKHFRLEKDIVLNNTDVEQVKHWSAYALDWVSIGNQHTYFSGIFDGKGHFISGLMQVSSTVASGLFGFVAGGTIKNLSIINALIIGTNHVGGICGHSEKSSFENCSFSEYENHFYPSWIYGNNYVGGIIGYGISCSITNCWNAGNVASLCYSGGIAGRLDSGSICLSYNAGRIDGYALAGGIVGSIASEDTLVDMEQCYNSGYVRAVFSVGGIAGWIRSGLHNTAAIAKNCYNSGSVCCSFYVCGGITSFGEGTNFINCYNSGFVSIESDEHLSLALPSVTAKILGAMNGCIAGVTYRCTMQDCFFLENVVCKKGVGFSKFPRIDNLQSLTGDEMQLKDSFTGFEFEGQNAVWTFAGSSEGPSNEYLFPQLIGLPHVSGSVYLFDYVFTNDDETKYASAAPFVFSNGTEYFSVDDYKMDGVYDELFHSLVDAEGENSISTKARVFLNKLSGSISGHCFGMAAVMALYMTGKIRMDVFQWRANAPYDFLNPINSRTVESLINFFHLSQNLQKIQNKLYFTRKDPVDRQNELISDMLKEVHDNNCVLLRESSNKKPLHYVVAYNIGASTDDGGTGTVGIWDPNAPQRVTAMTVTKKDSGYNIVNGLGEDYYLSAVIPLETLDDVCNKLEENVSWLNLNNFSAGKSKTSANASEAVAAQSADDCTTLITGLSHFEISNGSGWTAEVLDGEVQPRAGFAISDGIVLNEMNEEEADKKTALFLRQFALPNGSASYTITPYDDCRGGQNYTLLCSEEDGWYAIAETDEPVKISFDPAQRKVRTSPRSPEKQIRQTVVSGYENVGTAWDSVEISGITAGITQTINENNCCFSSESDGTMTVKVNDGINETQGYTVDVAPDDPEFVISQVGESRTMKITRQGSAVRAQGFDSTDNQNEQNTLGFTVFFVSGTDEDACNKSVAVLPGQKIKVEDRPTDPANPEGSAEYIFRGWYTTDGIKWDFDAGVTDNMRLIAKWEEIKIVPKSRATLIGRHVQMTVSGMDDCDSITWHSFNTKAAVIDSKMGELTLKKRGDSTIVATMTKDGKVYEATYYLHVYDPIEYVLDSIRGFLKKIFNVLPGFRDL